ncbi:TetR/AcrR family transcriptional regulator [Ramlibacter henchirensis]|uniref:TetR/AcrR family transcriptional regulator n=1 Tax=Ramlibacter henchirensis TaxID=204072 RepID=A0A4Z0C4J5_9BURK|nr:TetR/AcrR family transcriptional regulator [Ramlibacter henchirensis]TFZ06191.1 TetR/AcrR family transcriptional regulator [Ramlibacter henchirensis]
MGRGRHAGYDDQREAILASAARLFATQGYSATSMNQVADACGLSKATLYHYYRDKYALLFSIADTHVERLQRIASESAEGRGTAEAKLRTLIARLVEEYADAQDEHWVLTSEVRFLEPADRRRILDREREVVSAFAKAVSAVRPDLQQAALAKPLTMLLFGMVNWMFTWMKPDGALDHAAMAPIVSDLFLGGLGAVKQPEGSFSRSREKAGDEGERRRTLTPTLSRTREREQDKEIP